jgi:hypothetical protein
MRVALVIGSCVGFCSIALVALLAYGYYYYPQLFQKHVPWTNMKGVQEALGKPVCISTNPEGTIRWDYTHWWSGTARVYFDTNGNYFRTFTEF